MSHSFRWNNACLESPVLRGTGYRCVRLKALSVPWGLEAWWLSQ